MSRPFFRLPQNPDGVLSSSLATTNSVSTESSSSGGSDRSLVDWTSASLSDTPIAIETSSLQPDRSRSGDGTVSDPRTDAEAPSRLGSSVRTAVSPTSAPSAPMDRIRFRPIEPKDRVRVQYLHEKWFPVTYQTDFYDELVYQRMARTGEKLFTNVAVNSVNDQVVACVVGAMVEKRRLNRASRNLLFSSPEYFDRAFYIMTLGTEKQYRHMGLATMLVERCIEQVRQDPCCGALYLHVLTNNISAIHFYERLGFWKVQLIPEYYTINDEKRDCYLYAKYFHGNMGHLNFLIIAYAYLRAIWQYIRSPLAFGTHWKRLRRWANQRATIKSS